LNETFTPIEATAVVPSVVVVTNPVFAQERFSFDQRTPKRKAFGDAWDEHLDKGKVKKTKL
jgi:hypothetical protein